MRIPAIARFATALAVTLAAALPARAEVELSFYTGYQTSPHSRFEGTDAGTPFSFLAEWEGRSFEMPPYYGVRAMWWRNANWGFGAEFTHAKVYASDETLADNGLETLEMTDGINILTANLMYRWPGQWAGGKITPYVGGGLGVAIPHIEFQQTGGAETFEYQVSGPAARWIAGASYALNDNWALFGEYNGTYSSNKGDLEGGGEWESNILTNAINVGLSYNF
ncbi:MAG: outer membrane beta-barrel protein [Vannielia sp.]|uniref:outer membrane protein n=1 Tax=Rhodobacterales TaxID=204455 RepID=UPI002095718F|nr:outer membrane beta-barrel protein [Oceanicola sp. 502str15]MCO6384303.1 outer membrane beta-barrel protein [Oceanicola sp. 502str15]